MKIKIICFGKIKDNHLQSLITDYLAKIKHYTNIEIIELEEQKISNENSNGQIKEALRNEGMKLKKYFDKAFNILLDINAIQIDSIKFSQLVNQNLVSSKDIHFYIGSSHGIDNEIKHFFDMKLSFSQLTFNHQIFRLLLLEQIYRAFNILKNTNYHK